MGGTNQAVVTKTRRPKLHAKKLVRSSSEEHHGRLEYFHIEDFIARERNIIHNMISI